MLVDAKKILIVLPSKDWKRPPGCPCITCLFAHFITQLHT